jgi:hypothetical protein
MVLYYGRRYDASSAGGRIVAVVCAKCRCEYFYELARVGSGAASAPYAIGTSGAQRSATEQAQSDLQRRLAEEAELVPCPKCWWINDELVAGYRRGIYRGATKLALGLGIAGTVVSLAAAWFISLGPVADRGALSYALIGGPAISITLAVAILLMRYLLRARVRPNRNYPQAPKLPRGSPAALIKNLTTGELEPARGMSEPEFNSAGGGGAWMDFQVGRNTLPPVCCECLAPSSPGREYRRPVRPAVEVVVPLCTACARRWTRRLWLGAGAALALTAAIGLPVLYLMQVDETVIWIAVIGLAVVAPIVGSMVAGRISEPVRVKVVDSSRGVVRLWFRNEAVPKRIFASEAASPV